jgi:aryl-alcohol dehydrogenase-like predicted oxidoreductase
LQTDFIDLFQVHFFDPNTPLDETLRALDDIVRSGKARYIGCSNYLATQLAKALWISDKNGWAHYDCIQPRYNLLFREFEKELFPFCLNEGVGVICYNPLAGGMLTGKHRQDTETDGRFNLGSAGKLYKARYWHEAQFAAVERMKAFFTPRNKSIIEVAIAWVLQQPAVTSAIVGASKPEQLTDSVSGTSTPLDAEELAFLDDLWYDLPKSKNPTISLR